MSKFDEKLETIPVSTRWVTIYAWVCLPLGILASILNVLTTILVPSFSLRFSIFNLVFLIPLGLFSILTFIGMIRFLKFALATNTILLSLESLFAIYVACMVSFEIGSVVSVIGSILWMILNIIYFNKRKSLYNGEFPAL